jgi:hypothetical protein
MCLESARLLLHPWAEIDCLEFRPIAQDPRVMRYINDGQPWTDSVIQEFVKRQIEAYSVREYCRWKLILKDTGEMAGFCGAGMLDGLSDPEIGWWLAHRFWGQGLAIEAARVALKDIFTRIALERVVKAEWTHAAHVAVGTFWAGIPTREVEGIEDPLAAVRQAVERYGDQRRLHERYYSFDVVKSVHARRSWMAPDLL